MSFPLVPMGPIDNDALNWVGNETSRILSAEQASYLSASPSRGSTDSRGVVTDIGKVSRESWVLGITTDY